MSKRAKGVEAAGEFGGLVFFGWLAANVRENWGVEKVESVFGTHGVVYTSADDSEEPEEGDYATIGFVLPDGLYAEIESGTYGELQGIRIYKQDGAE